MAVPKKKKSKAKKRSHLTIFLRNFKNIANSNKSLVNSILKNKFSTNFLISKSKKYVELYNKIFFNF